MLIKILENTYEMPNVAESLNEIYQLIQQIIEEKNYIFSHMVVDQTAIFDNHEEYILENLSQIKEIEITIKPEQQMVIELLTSTLEYIERAIPEIQTLTDEFYGRPNEQTWEKLNQFLEALQWIIHVLQTLQTTVYKPNNSAEYQQISLKLIEHLTGLEDALVKQDYTLLADLTLYEILPLFEELATTIQQTFRMENIGSN